MHLLIKKIDLGSSFNCNLSTPSPMEFVLSDAIKQNTLRLKLNLEYGKRLIKSQFKTSPDAVAQLMFRLGHYKLSGKVRDKQEGILLVDKVD
ncbi:hypothetical protein MJO28_003909, partial [Puccinia striiformis f. sp. tritici]